MIAAVENAILARLRAAEDRLGYRWRTLETYPSNWDAYFKDKASIRLPGAWVVFGGFESFVEEAGGGARATASFGLVVAARNLRNETAVRHGSGDEAGSYQLLTDAAGLLVGDDLGLDIDRLELVRADFVDTADREHFRHMNLWALQLRTTLPIVALAGDDGLADFATFHANWDVPPFGGVDGDPALPGVQLPADASADATDHVVLPQ